DVPFFKRSGGGVTVSGGECLCQPDFLLAILKQCKEEGIHTAVDTTGFAPWSSIEKVLPYTDIFLYDLKNMDSRLHKMATGVPNELILENAQKIAKAGGKFQIRIPMIPLFNDSQESFEQFGKFILTLGDAVEVVQLLPYHKLGTVKWERLQKHNKVFESIPPKDELVQARKAYLESLGLNVMIH
ncbi:MAG: glycyl-radical enzyme activating protein, partial [Oscillospiraceae bacterium]|nr:glycyl-radical enzyme activating protein [Oscillospiraceae bacterium]